LKEKILDITDAKLLMTVHYKKAKNLTPQDVAHKVGAAKCRGFLAAAAMKRQPPPEFTTPLFCIPLWPMQRQHCLEKRHQEKGETGETPVFQYRIKRPLQGFA
jgi:hypothetical protein